jgi:hypothetical protein
MGYYAVFWNPVSTVMQGRSDSGFSAIRSTPSRLLDRIQCHPHTFPQAGRRRYPVLSPNREVSGDDATADKYPPSSITCARSQIYQRGTQNHGKANYQDGGMLVHCPP